MNAEEYLKNRLEDQIEWYEKKSMWNKNLLLLLRVVEIVCAAMIPLLSGYLNYPTLCIAIIIGVLGVIIAISAGTIALFQFQEHWIEYRSTAECLKIEKFLFLTQVEPYDEDNSLEILVNRTETLIAHQNTNWAQNMKKSKTGENNG